ncbi:ABC transporter permease [Piscirickettsia salmonis]|uniref:ABC transporter permease n=1 Tax=Piscirickettsia salmonis TaxID=1238 RepID=UPI0007C98444|nr:Oligopeptide transport system permease protein OppC [Piscirickettsiaceae bacterium NZ-RLO1]
MTRISFWRRFSKNPLAICGGVLVLCVGLLALFAGFIAPYGADDYGKPYTNQMPPTVIHVVHPETGKLAWPFVYGYQRSFDKNTFTIEYHENKSEIYALQFFISGSEYRLFGVIPMNIHLFGVRAPGKLFIFGCDRYGRDIFSRIVWGAQISLLLALTATCVSLILGCIIGGIAGYVGGWLDNLIMRFIEVIYAIPTLFLLLALRALLPMDLDPLYVMYAMVLILGLLGWGGLARVVRGSVLSLKTKDHVLAAKVLGFSRRRILFLHILPELYGFILVTVTLAIPANLLITSFLSFLGLGVNDPYVDWGLLLNNAQTAGAIGIMQMPWILIPGLFLIITVVAFNLLGDGIRDLLDPRQE